MINLQPLMWRKGIILSATFLFALFLSFSCKKKDHILGHDTLNPNEQLVSGGIDTFQLTTYTIFQDSVIADNPALAILGSYNDPVFGTVNSEIYTQFRLPALNPDFGDISLISIDSVILGLEYAGYYGETGNQIVEVFEITDTEVMHVDSTYYSTDTFLTSSTTLVPPGQEVMNFNPSNPTYIDTVQVDPQLRIPIDTNFGWNIINTADLADGTFDSNDNFLEFFKGFLIRTNNGFQNPGEGGLFYFSLTDTDSELTIYYTQDGVKKAYNLVINSECADFNHIDIVQSAKVQQVIDDTVSGQFEFYAQSFQSRARVEIPGISNIPPNAVVHKATLELPVQFHTGTPYSPGLDISVLTYLSAADPNLYSVGTTGYYDNYKKQFTIDLRSYVQAVINGEIENQGLILSPLLFITSGDRIVFNGPGTTNKDKPRFSIVYTEF